MDVVLDCFAILSLVVGLYFLARSYRNPIDHKKVCDGVERIAERQK